MNSVAHFTPECDRCEELLTEYIAASNQIVETKGCLHSRKPPSASQLASALIDNALKRKNLARKQLFTHQAQRH